MKEHFYQYEAKSGRHRGKNVITVCIIKDENGRFCRGVSVCSPGDSPNGLQGQKYSRNHARHASLGRKGVPITNIDAIKTLFKTDCPFVLHSEINPTLTFQEISLFKTRDYKKIVEYNLYYNIYQIGDSKTKNYCRKMII